MQPAVANGSGQTQMMPFMMMPVPGNQASSPRSDVPSDSGGSNNGAGKDVLKDEKKGTKERTPGEQRFVGWLENRGVD